MHKLPSPGAMVARPICQLDLSFPTSLPFLPTSLYLQQHAATPLPNSISFPLSVFRSSTQLPTSPATKSGNGDSPSLPLSCSIHRLSLSTERDFSFLRSPSCVFRRTNERQWMEGGSTHAFTELENGRWTWARSERNCSWYTAWSALFESARPTDRPMGRKTSIKSLCSSVA